MTYQSPVFLLFAMLTLLLYYLLGKKLQKWVLLAANIVFYISAGYAYLPFIIVTLLTTFVSGLLIGKIYRQCEQALQTCEAPDEKKQIRQKAKRKAKQAMLLGLLVALALLIFCKYTNFIVDNINHLLEAFQVAKIDMFDIILPIGISYYTFMAISYVLDIYWKRYEAETSLLNYAVYLTYFPHIVQGPIDRYNKIKAQFDGGVKLDVRNLKFGAQLVIWGFFKKMVIADRISPFVNEIFSNYQQYEGILFIIAVVMYSVQLYADFSGCVDICSGISQMFGIRLTKNFNHPFFAKTIPEYWRRWHISLQEWFKDYLYYPISLSGFFKNTRKKLKKAGHLRLEFLFAGCMPALVIWLTTGVWHGASWGYVLWGLYNAFLFMGGTAFGEFNQKLTVRLKIDTQRFSWRLFQMIRTFILTTFGRLFVRASSISVTWYMCRSMFTQSGLDLVLNDNIYKYGIAEKDFHILIIAIAIMWIVDMLQEKMSIREELEKQGTILRWSLIILGIVAILVFGCYGPGYDAAAFIYGRY